ncbi:TPA: hypothetical protein ACMDSI_002563 [Vibrio parahaemolyticus]|uniref:hypothetical protein n=1 Tax=Vibrio diabolicus TaxID=50719 RepID=UPI00080F3D53|nr:hypothetical protein [Vibrio diabolicus]OCH65103.1 hypothetical protein A6E00_03565 [Vibrio diabolicus]
MIENNTFCVGINSNSNATVGFNGSGVPVGEARSNIDYAIGFSSAALELIDVALTSEKLENSVDYLVYPICFNMRHAVELQLKKLWQDLTKLASYRNVTLTEHRNRKIKANPELRGIIKPFPEIDEASTHDLRAVWKLVKEYAPLIDSRFVNFVVLLSPFINDLAAIDSTGQTFRYPSSHESEVHLKQTSIINIEILKTRFSNLVEILKLLEEVSNNMLYEYGFSSITNKLSHFDVIRATYHAAKFLDSDVPYYKAAKVSTQKQFDISSNEYSRLVKIAVCDKTINHILKIENKPDYLDLDSLMSFFDLLDKVYPMKNYVEKFSRPLTSSVFNIGSDFRKEEIEKMLLKQNTIKNVSEVLSLNQIAEIYALYEFHRQSCHFGIFKSMLQDNIEVLEAYNEQSDSSEIHAFIKHFFEKSNLISGILTSLWVLNMKSLVRDVATKYNFVNVPWFEKLEREQVSNGLSEYEWFEHEVEKLTFATESANQSIQNMRITN